MPEVRPHAEEDEERDILGSCEVEVVQEFGEGEEGVGDVHRGVDGIADQCQVDSITPAVACQISALCP